MSTKKVKGLMKVLMVTSYKGKPIYIRQIDTSFFLWDVIIDNLLYSSYIVIKPKKGEKKLSSKEVDEVVKMCYAGAAATVDNILGVELSDSDKDMVDRFTKARVKVKKILN